MATDRDHQNITGQEQRDFRILALFIGCWCRARHHDTRESLPLPLSARDYCPECCDLLAYALARRGACPLHPKPACKDCPVHCYHPARRTAIRQIMRFSGGYLLRRGRLDLLWHYFF